MMSMLLVARRTIGDLCSLHVSYVPRTKSFRVIDSFKMLEQPNEIDTIIPYFIDEEIERQERLCNSFKDS